MSKISNTMNAVGRVVIVGAISMIASNVMAQASNVNWMAYMKDTKAKIAEAEEALRTRNPQSSVYQKAQRDLPVLQNTLAWQIRESDKKTRARGVFPNTPAAPRAYDHQAELYRLGVRDGVPSPYSSVPPYPAGRKPVEHSLWDISSRGYQEYGRDVINASSVRPGTESSVFTMPDRPLMPPETYAGTSGYTKVLGMMRNQITSFPDELIHHILPGDVKALDGTGKTLTTAHEKMLYIREELFGLYARLQSVKTDEARKNLISNFEKQSGISESRLTVAFAARDAMFEYNGLRQDYQYSLLTSPEMVRGRNKVDALRAEGKYRESNEYDRKISGVVGNKVDKKFPARSPKEYLSLVTSKSGDAKPSALKAWIERSGLSGTSKVSKSMGLLGIALAATASTAANAGEAEAVETEPSAPVTFSRSEFRPSAARGVRK